VIAEPVTSMTSVLSGISTVEFEAGTVTIGAVIAALPLTILGFLWSRVLVSFRGQAAEGTVAQTERSTARSVKAQVKFRASDGREISLPLNMAPTVGVGDTVHLRYNPARPEVATNRTAGTVTTHVLLPLGTLATVGLIGLVGTFWSVATGRFDGFVSAYAVVVFLTISAYTFLIAYIRYAEVRAARPSAGRLSAARSVRGPTFVGLFLLAFGAYAAVVFFG
jgi:Protein of unknown function (DUF3592)